MDHKYAPVHRTDLVTLLFMYLKLTETIDWSWWWVLSPFIISILVGLLPDVPARHVRRF